MGNTNRIYVVIRDAYGNVKDGGLDTLSAEVLEPEPVKSHVQPSMNQIQWIADQKQSVLHECRAVARHVPVGASYFPLRLQPFALLPSLPTLFGRVCRSFTATPRLRRQGLFGTQRNVFDRCSAARLN